jgi:hypothetical protein
LEPSSAASALLASLSLPAGVATVWPSTRDGQMKLVVRLERPYWPLARSIPLEFEGYPVDVEPNRPVPAQDGAKAVKLFAQRSR